MSDNPNDYNFPFRKNYELRIAAVWCIAAIALTLIPLIIDVPISVYWFGAAASLVIAILLGGRGIELAIRTSRLKGYPIEAIDPHSKATMALFGIEDKEVIRNVTSKKKR